MMTDNHTIIIAEIGVNHEGSLDLACRMIREAAAAGCDYAKFQTFKSENLVCRTAERAGYQKRNCGGDETQLDMLRRYELSAGDFAFLQQECSRNGIGFLSSAFDPESISLLESIPMDYWKIPSGEITNLPYLRRIARPGRKIILSTGMSDIDEVKAAVSVFEAGDVSRGDIVLLHCNTQYPTPMCDVNLRAMDTLATLGCGMVGYSDHTPGITVPVAAVARGARMLEKHFTLDKTLPGPDHRASLEPSEMRAMVSAVRDVEMALGSAEKRVTESERANAGVARKSIVAARRIVKGAIITECDIAAKRPGTGLSPMMWDSVTGSVAVRDFEPDEQIEI